MPTVRLSGNVKGKSDPKRKDRAQMLYHLFANGWDIYNGNGDQTTHLSNIQRKILESDAFVFTPNPNLDDYFNLTSIFVAFQTLDKDLEGKPAIILNSDGSWNNFLGLIDHLYKLGTVREKYSQYITVVNSTAEVLKELEKVAEKIDPAQVKVPQEEPDIITEGAILSAKPAARPERSVCVFCSASIRKQEYLDDGYLVGELLTKAGLGCISGAGKTGIMGQVVKGSYESGGWAAGSNVPHIIRLEGLPEGLSEFWPRSDIYTRMEIMIEESHSFVIMPGGMGTVQELLALLILKSHKADMMQGKKIVVYNRRDEQTEEKFWYPLFELLKEHDSFEGEFIIVDTVEELMNNLK